MDEKVRDGDPPSQLLRRAKGHHRQVAAATAPQYFAVRWTPGQLSAARRRSEIAATIERYRRYSLMLYVMHVYDHASTRVNVSAVVATRRALSELEQAAGLRTLSKLLPRRNQ